MKNVFDRMAAKDENAFEPAGDSLSQPSMNGDAVADAEEGPIRTSAEVKEVTQEPDNWR